MTEDNRTIELVCPPELLRSRLGINYTDVYKHGSYYSSTCERERGFSYLLPPSYDENEKYPVLYLFHGMFGDELSMTEDDKKVKELFYNMMADGLVQPFITIFPNLYASKDPGMTADFAKPETLEPYNDSLADMENDLIPYVESNFPVLPGRENRWFAGFSMGGRQAMYFLAKKPYLARHMCAMAPAPGLVPGKDWAMTHPGLIKDIELTYPKGPDGLDVFVMCYGLHDGVVGNFPAVYHDILLANGCEHYWIQPDCNHGNVEVQCGLYNFLKFIGGR